MGSPKSQLPECVLKKPGPFGGEGSEGRGVAEVASPPGYGASQCFGARRGGDEGALGNPLGGGRPPTV